MHFPHPHLQRLPSSIRIRRSERDVQQRAADFEDDRLQLEVRLAERARRDQQAEAGPSQAPQFSGGDSFTRRGSRSAVENLALRHKERQRQERHELKRRRRFNSTSSSGSSLGAGTGTGTSATNSPVRVALEPHELSAVSEERTPGPFPYSGANYLDPGSLQGRHSYFTPKRGRIVSPNAGASNSTTGVGQFFSQAYQSPDRVSSRQVEAGGENPVDAAEGPETSPQRRSSHQLPSRSSPAGPRAMQSASYSRNHRPRPTSADLDLEAQNDSGDGMDEADRNDANLTPTSSSSSSDMHVDEVVDYLDVVDPEISTVTTLQNVGNSIFFPPIPRLYSRRPTFTLPSAGPRSEEKPLLREGEAASDSSSAGDYRTSQPDAVAGTASAQASKSRRNTLTRMSSLMSFNFGKAGAPEPSEAEKRKHISEWALMDVAERNELDEHVAMLLTRKAKFKRAMKGFGKYVRTPMGFIITLYGFLVTFWGIAICLFIFRWIDVGDQRRWWIEICDQILCALFAAVGIGFAPFRAVDTYRMVQIAHYHRLTYKRRKELDLPKLQDKNELPRSMPRLAQKITRAAGLGRGDAPQSEEQAQKFSPDTTLLSAAGAQSRSVSARADEPETKRGAGPVPDHPLRTDPRTGSPSTNGDSPDPALVEEESQSEGEQRTGEGQKKGHRVKRLHRKRVKTVARKPLDSSTVDKDGVIPLGQLRRTASIASELPKDQEDVVVLSEKQQANLEHQQRKFHESHTFYRYRETITHRPFELSLMMTVVILLDCHSCLQTALGGTTWGIYWKVRPTAVTATLISCSLSCNIVAGILIWWGGHRTKKTEEVERLLRIALEEEALAKIERRKKRAEEKENEVRRLENGGAQQGFQEGIGVGLGKGEGGKEVAPSKSIPLMSSLVEEEETATSPRASHTFDQHHVNPWTRS